MVIQFGHNDMEKVDGVAENDRQVSMADYEANLRRFVDEARAAGIKPILCTPLTRRYFESDAKIHSDLTKHTATMKKVAAEMKVPLIDLQTESIASLDKIGETAETSSPSRRKIVTARRSSIRHTSIGPEASSSAEWLPWTLEKSHPS